MQHIAHRQHPKELWDDYSTTKLLSQNHADSDEKLNVNYTGGTLKMGLTNLRTISNRWSLDAWYDICFQVPTSKLE